MSVIRITRLLSIASAVAAGAMLTSLSVVPSPAYAGDGDIDVRLSGLTSSLSAGRGGDGFSVRSENKTDEPLIVTRVIIVRLDGLTADQVRIIRGVRLPANSAGPGEVQFIDTLPFRLNSEDRRGDSATANYRIEFLDGAPSGQARVTAEAYVNRERFGSDSDEMTVRGGSTAPPSTTPPTSAPPSASTGPTVALSPLEAEPAAGTDSGDGTGIPVFLYLMGAVLVAMGGGILWLLLRQRPAAVDSALPSDGYPPANTYQTGYSSQSAPTSTFPTYGTPPQHSPTSVMPVIRAPQSPPPLNPPGTPPAFDPWAPPPGNNPRDAGRP